MRRIRLIAAAGAALLAASMWAAPAHAGTVGTVEAETMNAVDGYGLFVYNDATASAGKALMIDSNVRARKSVTLSGAADTIVVRAHTDAGVTPATMRVNIDGTPFADVSVAPSTWTNYTFTRSLAAGSHTLTIRFLNADARNLYVDVTTFTGPDSPPPPPPSGETSMQAYVTGYSWYDNTPPGSADISHPVIHSTAGGTGTYADPITVAVGHDLSSGSDVLDWPAGTRFYMPYLHRYFIVEDTCGDGPTPENGPCHTGYPAPATTWLDVWVGGQSDTEAQANACMNSITDVHTAIKDPASNYVVASGDIAANGGCTQQFSETPQTNP